MIFLYEIQLLLVLSCAYNTVIVAVTGPPKIMLDPFGSEVKVNAGEPFRVKIPFKGSPIPDATWLNVRHLVVNSGSLKLYSLQITLMYSPTLYKCLFI